MPRVNGISSCYSVHPNLRATVKPVDQTYFCCNSGVERCSIPEIYPAHHERPAGPCRNEGFKTTTLETADDADESRIKRVFCQRGIDALGEGFTKEQLILSAFIIS